MSSRRNWTEEEEKTLAELQTGDFRNSWNLIAKELNERFVNKNRTGKQCRERFINYIQAKAGLKPCLKWEQPETSLFYSLYREYGPKWTIISRIIEGKSENSLKNMFYGSLRKTTRAINRIEKDFGVKRTKPIKYESLLRIVSSNEKQCWPLELTQGFQKLKAGLLILMEGINEEPAVEEVLELISLIHSFNSDLKSSFNQKKVGSCESKSFEAINESCEELYVRFKKPLEFEAQLSCATDKSQQSEQDFSKVLENLKKMQSFSHAERQHEVLAREKGSCSMMICEEGSPGRLHSCSNTDLNYDLCSILNRPYSSDCFEFTF